MKLSKIRIRNYRLLVDAELEVDSETTLIVGRNNTAKTSCLTCIKNAIDGNPVFFDDYPLSKREDLYNRISSFMRKEISYDDFCEQIETISIDFFVDYSSENDDIDLGSLSPFIIDLDDNITHAQIHAEYCLQSDEKTLRSLFENVHYENISSLENKTTCNNEIHVILNNNFAKLFSLVIYAVNPQKENDRQIKSQKELRDLFPLYTIPAERVLGEDDAHNSSLSSLITSFFNMEETDLGQDVIDKVKELRDTVERANKEVQEKSDSILSTLVDDAVGFGYPQEEELSLKVATQLSIDEQIKNQTKLLYASGRENENLPNSYNGLGYKNLIKIEFLLASFAKNIKRNDVACVPLLFIEEPESHMHPQMQTAFTAYIEDFLKQLEIKVQVLLTSHSAHVVNTIEFSKIRYAQKHNGNVNYKNLNDFVENDKKENDENMDFIKKYLSLTKCDLFFADKAIFIEGTSERLLLPDMIRKCEADGMFSSHRPSLSAQYYTLIEIGGAYAHRFVPFVEFLDIPCLILTDLDPVAAPKNEKQLKAALPSEGETTSNATIKYWVRKNKGQDDTYKVNLSEIISMNQDDKTRGKCHIEFQVEENGLCGRSLEESIRNVNRKHYKLGDNIKEEELEFNGKSKTDFALELIDGNLDYCVPKYIKSGLKWLNEQKVFE